MRLLKLQISNFCSYGKDQEVDFTRLASPTLVEGQNENGSNGAGKSALFEALFWCLTGKNTRGVKAAEVIRAGEKYVEVTACFIYKEKTYTVTRHYASSKKTVEIQIGDEEFFYHDSKQATVDLFEKLGTDEATLGSLLFFGSNYVKFSQLSPAKKAETLQEMSHNEVFDTMQENLKNDAKRLKDETERLLENIDKGVTKKGELDISLNKLKDKLDSLQYNIDNEVSEITKTIISSNEELTLLDEDQDTYKKKLEIIKGKDGEITAKNDMIAKLRSEKIQIQQKTWDNTEEIEITNQISMIAEKIGGLRAEKKNKAELIDGSVCKTCGQEIDEIAKNKETIMNEIQILDEKLIELEDEKIKNTNARSKVREEKDEFQAGITKEGNAIQRKIDNLQNAIQGQARETIDAQADLTKVNNRIRDVENEIQRLNTRKKLLANNTEKVTLTSKIEETINRVEEETAILQKNKEDFTILSLEYDMCRYWKKSMNTIRFKMLDTLIDLLQEYLTYYTRKAGLHFDTLIVDTQRETADKKRAISAIDINITRGKNIINLASLSEGESQRVNIAIFFAMCALTEEIKKVKIDLKVLDEMNNGLDEGGRQNIFDLINELAESNFQIFIIDHNADFSDKYTSRIKVVKDKMITKIS